MFHILPEWQTQLLKIQLGVAIRDSKIPHKLNSQYKNHITAAIAMLSTIIIKNVTRTAFIGKLFQANVYKENGEDDDSND